MDKIFLTILNMSFTGAFVIAAVIIARLFLKKAPKIISYCLWAVVAFRLIFPFSIESVFSFIPFNAQPIPSDIATQPVLRIDSGISFVNEAVSSVLPAAEPAASVNPLQLWTFIGSWVWIIGTLILFLYGVASYIILKRKMRHSAHLEANIYEASNIKSPFVLGIINPMIYLPTSLSKQERRYILLHEQTHIKRKDHIVKFGAYFILCLHWFNPLAWVAFLLMGADMEMSCDECVLKEMGGKIKKDYSLSLLSMATERRFIGGSPLAFGEGGVKERLKNVLKFKKTSRVIVIAAVALLIVLSVGFTFDRLGSSERSWELYNQYEMADMTMYKISFYTDNSVYPPTINAFGAMLINTGISNEINCGDQFTLVKQVGDNWRVVPLKKDLIYNDIVRTLKIDENATYGLVPTMLEKERLTPGVYRIVTDIWYDNGGISELLKVWGSLL